jgi:hypothetical protein
LFWNPGQYVVGFFILTTAKHATRGPRVPRSLNY